MSTELAARLGVDRPPVLGLTESLERGYRLSPRGRAVLVRIEAGG